VHGARGVIINVTGGSDLSLMEVNEASCVIQQAAHEDANIIFGAVVDPQLVGTVKITVIATGFDRVSSRLGPAATSETPTDLNIYTAQLQRSPEAAQAGITDDRAPIGSAGDVAFEPSSPLDVPAFLRRQS